MFKGIIKYLFCGHKKTTKYNVYYDEYWGQVYPCEYRELCNQCGKTRYYNYGNFSKWERVVE